MVIHCRVGHCYVVLTWAGTKVQKLQNLRRFCITMDAAICNKSHVLKHVNIVDKMVYLCSLTRACTTAATKCETILYTHQLFTLITNMK